MSDLGGGRRRSFRRAFGGYRRSDVDRYVAEVEQARAAWSAELARLRKVEPLARLGDDIADLLTSFAQGVAGLQDRLAADAQTRRAEAEQYAQRRMADADHMLETARQKAHQLTTEMILEAQAELAALADQQLSIADALDRAAEGIAVSRDAIAKIRHSPAGLTVTPINREAGRDGRHAAPDGLGSSPARFAN